MPAAIRKHTQAIAAKADVVIEVETPEVRLDAVAAVLLDGLSYRRAGRMVGISRCRAGRDLLHFQRQRGLRAAVGV